MLNDLYILQRNLGRSGVATVGRHPAIKDMAKGPAVRVLLAEGGGIVGLELIAEAGSGRIWTLRDGQHNGFPGLKTPAGLLALAEDEDERHKEAWKAAKDSIARRAELDKLIKSSQFNSKALADWPGATHQKRIEERLEALRPLSDHPEAAAVPAAFERFLKCLIHSEALAARLLAALAERLENGDETWLEPIRAFLIGPAQFVVDVPIDNSDFRRSAADPRQIGQVSVALGATAGAQGRSGTCALSGADAALHSGNFPQPNLPGLGQTYLFSRNTDIPSLARYGKTADASFAIDADLLQGLSGALSALTEQHRKGKTWTFVPAERGKDPDLLLACFGDPDLPAADGLNRDEVDPEDETDGDGRAPPRPGYGQGALHELGSRVMTNAEGQRMQTAVATELTVTVLRAVDPANRKVVYRHVATPQQFANAAHDWDRARYNLPSQLVLRLPNKDKRLVQRRPIRVAPLSLVPLSRRIFVNGGRRPIDVPGILVADAYALFLGETTEQKVRQLLFLLVRRHGDLLAGLAQANTMGIDYLKSFDPKLDLRRDALRSVAFFGILLSRLGRDKETYMSDTAFRLGQLLHAADVVHVGYCADMRNGEVPPSLVGNSFLTMMDRSPERALAMLKARMKPYIAWAKRREYIDARVGKLRHKEPKTPEQKRLTQRSWDIDNGRWAAIRLQNVAKDLTGKFGANPLSDHEQAELLLGYLAGFPRPKETNDTEAIDPILENEADNS